MTLRRLSAALPLAVLVAVLVHIAGVGFQHSLGGSHAVELDAGLGAALSLAALVAFFSGALRPSASSIATAGSRDYPPWLLAAGGFAVYLGIELLEGHLELSGALRALFAVLPAALAVAAASRCFEMLAGRAGARFAGFARSRGCGERAERSRRSADGLRHASLFCQSKTRGRAPPLFA